jgi:hypothetical protein
VNRVFHWFSGSWRETHASFQRGVVAMRGVFARHIAHSIAVYDARRLALRAARARRIAIASPGFAGARSTPEGSAESINLGHAARLLGAGT